MDADASGSLPLFGHSTSTALAAAEAEGFLPLFGDANATNSGMLAGADGFLPLFGDAAAGAIDVGATLPGSAVQMQAEGFLPLWGSASTLTLPAELAPGWRAAPLTVGHVARIIRAPGRIVIGPVEPLRGGTFPYGGTEIGRANLCALQPLGEAYRVENEGLGEVGDILEAGNRWVFSCFLRGWDDRAVELLLQSGFERGAVTQHAVFSVPGTRAAGRSALGRAVVLVYVPDDPIHVPGVLLYRAVPDVSAGADLAFQRGNELGLPLTFECVRDSQGRIVQVGRLADLEIPT